MAFETVKISGENFSLSMPHSGASALELELGGVRRFALGRCLCGGFSEEGALLKKLRRHGSLDGLSASLDATSIVPFGCEYKVQRQCEVCGSIALYDVDIAAVAYGVVSAVELEPVSFYGVRRGVAYRVFGGAGWVEAPADASEIYSGAEPLLGVRVEFDDGSRVEFSTGCDIWRHRAALRLPQTTGSCRLAADGETLTLYRKIFTFEPEARIDKRPWKFKNSFAWSLPGETAAEFNAGAELDLAAAALPAGAGKPDGTVCLTSAPVRRLLRDFVRKNQNTAVRVCGAAPGVCDEPAHLERPGKGAMEHADLDDCIALYLWGNHCTSGQGGSLIVELAPGSLWYGGVIAGCLARPPRRISAEI